MSGPRSSDAADVHDDRLFQVWRTNPGVLSQPRCRGSLDPDLKAFAEQLDPSFQIIDLRNPQIGFGFSWGRYGPNTLVRWFGALPILGYQKRRGLRERLFGAAQ